MDQLLPLSEPLDYQVIADAQRYYSKLGYTEIAVPWIVRYEAYNVTRPADKREFYTLDGYLNASGEQGYVDLMLAGKALTKNACITTCFRYDDLDAWHQRIFVKLELIQTDVSSENLQTMIADAKRFFDRFIPSVPSTAIIQTDASGMAYDIVDSETGIELGSYGIRQYKHLRWIYGTGVALPRLSLVVYSKRSAPYVNDSIRARHQNLRPRNSCLE